MISNNYEEGKMETIDHRIGYMVAGYVGGEPTPEGGRTLPVLAHSEDEAIEIVLEENPDLNIVGMMTEAQLMQQIEGIRALRASNPV